MLACALIVLAACADPYADGVATAPAEPRVAAASATFAPPTPAPTPTPASETPTPPPTAAPIVATSTPTPADRATPTPSATPAVVATPTRVTTATATATPRAHGDPATPSLLDASRIVSVYGAPDVPAMGVLGAGAPEDAAAKAESLAREYTALDPSRPAIPAFHLIVAVAQPLPGADGTYLARLADTQVQQYVDIARAQHMLLFLDVQVGWSDPLTEVEALAPYLAEPFVHVALDPEFATRPLGEAPGQAIGVLSATQVNAVQAYLAQLVIDRGLPPKILIVHQFLERMLDHADAIGRYTGVSLVIDMDGFGAPALKLFKYDRYAEASYAEFPAIKLFYKWDDPLMSASDLLALPDPPRIVIYQ